MLTLRIARKARQLGREDVKAKGRETLGEALMDGLWTFGRGTELYQGYIVGLWNKMEEQSKSNSTEKRSRLEAFSHRLSFLN